MASGFLKKRVKIEKKAEALIFFAVNCDFGENKRDCGL